jgi:hypothetical protein
MLDIANKNYLGNASRSAQFVRLVKQYETTNYSKASSVDMHLTSAKEAKSALRLTGGYYKFNQLTKKIPGSSEELKTAEEGSETHTVVRVNPTAEAGPPYPTTVKKSQTVTTDVESFDKFINGTFRPWMALSNVKPKREVYSLAEASTKVRNINVFNSGLSLPSLVFVNAVSTQFNHNGYKSLAGVPLYHGTAKKLIDSMWVRGQGCTIYSDNMFRFYIDVEDNLIIRSLDGVKMESCHVTAQCAVDMFWTIATQVGVENIPAQMQHHMTQVAPHAMINNWGIFGDTLVRIPGLASGANITFLLNHFKMAIAATIIDKRDPSEEVEEMNKAISETGIKLETHIRS